MRSGYYRRHQYERRKSSVARRLWATHRDLTNRLGSAYLVDDFDVVASIGRETNTRSVCSCCLCGNPRNYFGTPTIQEIKADIDMNDQILELGLR